MYKEKQKRTFKTKLKRGVSYDNESNKYSKRSWGNRVS